MVGPRLSVVVPVYNEREGLAEFVARLVPVLQRVGGGSFEVVFVDDGSTDGSPDILDGFHEHDPHLKVLHLSRNFGHQAALQAGLAEAAGEAVVLMDADLQDRPETIEVFVEKWAEGYDVVYAVRRRRKEGLVKRAHYALFYRTLRAVAQIDVALDAGDSCLLDRCVVNALAALPEQHRFLRGLRSWIGFRQVGIPCERDARHAGTSKYTPRKLVGLALSGYVGFSSAPLRLASLLGVICAAFGLVIVAWWSRPSCCTSRPREAGRRSSPA